MINSLLFFFVVMPVFNKEIFVTKANQDGSEQSAAKVKSTQVFVGNKPIAAIFLGGGSDDRQALEGRTYPFIACICGDQQVFRRSQNFRGRTKEDYIVRCTVCNLRIPGSAGETLISAAEQGFCALRIAFCNKSGRPMTYLTRQSGETSFAFRCTHSPFCTCEALKLSEALIRPERATVLPDELLQELKYKGVSRALLVKGEALESLPAFIKAIQTVRDFVPEGDLIDPDEVPKPEKKVAGKRRGGPAKNAKPKRLSVKEASKLNSKRKAEAAAAAAAAADDIEDTETSDNGESGDDAEDELLE
jgi:hypothetical protein